MFTLLIVFALLWFAFIASMKVFVATLIVAGIVTTVVKYCTRVIVGTDPSHLESLKAVALSLLFVGIAIITMMSFSIGWAKAPFSLAALSLPIVVASPLLGYTLGFRIGLGIGFGHAAIIAVLSTSISGALAWVFSKTAFAL